MFLILCGDPKQVPQESLLLKSIVTCFGMQPTNMISTMLQVKNKGKLSFPIKLTHSFTKMMLGKIPHLIQMRMIHPHTQFFNPLSTLLNHKNLPKFLFTTNFGENFFETAKKMIIEYNERLTWLPQDHSVAIPNLNLLWVNPIPSPSESIFMRMTFLLNTFILKILPKQWCMSA